MRRVAKKLLQLMSGFIFLPACVFAQGIGFSHVYVSVKPGMYDLPSFGAEKKGEITVPISLTVMRCPLGQGTTGEHVQLDSTSSPFASAAYYSFRGTSLRLFYSVKEELSEYVFKYGDPDLESYYLDTGVESPRDCEISVAGRMPFYVGEYEYNVVLPNYRPRSYDLYVSEYKTDEDGNIVERTNAAFLGNIELEHTGYFIFADPKNSDDFKFNLEQPASGSTVGGVAVLRGWACWVAGSVIRNVSYQIDDLPVSQVPYGSGRKDTKTACDGKTKNGFATVVNWNRFGNGEHTLKLFVNDELVEERTFTVFGVAESYQTDLSGEYELEDFPAPGQTAVVRWSTAAQDFVLVSVK